MTGKAGSRARLPRLVIAMGSLYVALGGVVAILLPAQVERIDPAGKVSALAVVSAIAFAVTLFAQPLIGTAGDRTLGRFGDRRPWMLGSALVGGGAIALLGWSPSLIVVGALWALGQFALNGADISVSSAVVDEFPRGRRGVPSGALAASVAVGAGGGVVLAGVLAASPHTAFLALASVAVVGALAFVLLPRNPLLPRTAAETPAGRTWAERLVALRHPDFFWVLASRFGFTLAQQSVSVYLLYIVTDYTGVVSARGPATVAALTATGLVGLLVTAAVCGWWSDRLGRRRVLLVGSAAVFGIGMLVPLLFPVLPALFVCAALQGIALGAHLAVGGALLAEVLPGGDGHAGRDLGLANTVVNAAQSLAPVIAGAIVVVTGGYQSLFLFAAAAAALSAAAAWRVRGAR